MNGTLKSTVNRCLIYVCTSKKMKDKKNEQTCKKKKRRNYVANTIHCRYYFYLIVFRLCRWLFPLNFMFLPNRFRSFFLQAKAKNKTTKIKSQILSSLHVVFRRECDIYMFVSTSKNKSIQYTIFCCSHHVKLLY